MSKSESSSVVLRGATNGLKAIRNGIRAAISREEIVVLRKDLARKSDPGLFTSLGFAVEVHRGDAAASEVVRVYEDMGRHPSLEMIKKRLATGLEFYALRLDGRLAATTWLVLPGRRFIDEIGYHLAVPEQHLWVRDIFVAAWARGRGLFATVLDAVLANFHRDATVLWSDTDSENHASLRAHGAFGFAPVGTMTVVNLGNQLMVRSAPPAAVKCVGGFRPERRVVLTGRRYEPYRDTHLA